MFPKVEELKFNAASLIPAVIQDASTKKVLMLGYMNAESYRITLEKKLVTFFSRSRNQLWTKGETSGNYLYLKDIKLDCDADTLLISAQPVGAVCHTGNDTCFDEKNSDKTFFLNDLQNLLDDRFKTRPKNSYTTKLFEKGVNKMAQKVGEEAVELVIEAKDNNDDLFLNEAADLLFHTMVLLTQRGYGIQDVAKVLFDRHFPKSDTEK